jgi:hypothetical protein
MISSEIGCEKFGGSGKWVEMLFFEFYGVLSRPGPRSFF